MAALILRPAFYKMTHFSSRFAQKVDPKGRVCVSSKLINCLDDRTDRRFRVCPGEVGVKSPCLFLRFIPEADYPKWASWANPIFDGPKDPRPSDERRRALRFLSQVHFVELDKQGRFIIPEELRNAAGISADAVMVGAGNMIEIWAADKFEAWLDGEEL